MDGIGFLIIGVATAFNLLIIKHKFETARYEDGIFDLSLLIILASVFANSFGGLVVATISSAIISLYLLASPPSFFSGAHGLVAKFKAKTKKGRACKRFSKL